MNMIDNFKVIRVEAAAAAGTSDLDSDGVDTQGFEGVLFLVHFGTITSGAVTSIKAAMSSDDGDADAYADLLGSSVTIADDDDGKVALLDIYRPRERYVRCTIDRGTQNAVVDGITAILYGAHKKPVTHDSATVVSGEAHYSPAAGTA